MVYCFTKLPPTSLIIDKIQYLCFYVWLISPAWCPPSPSMLPPKTGFSFLLRLNNIPLHMYTTRSWSIHLLMYLGFFNLLAAANKAAVNIVAQLSVWGPSFKAFRYIPRNEVVHSFFFLRRWLSFSCLSSSSLILCSTAQL